MSNGDSIDIKANRVDEIACGQCGHVLNVSTLPVFSTLQCPKCRSKLTVPALLGPFLLLEQLGTGGMGAVYRGLDQALGRFVAIKVMKKALGDDQKLVESFLREARTAAALNHPNVVQIYSCGQENGQPYIAMELVSGGRLDQLMADGKTVGEVRLLEIALDVSEGLKAANGVGLVHGDIKPANILLDRSGTAKVVDFGLAQFVNRQQQRGEIWGTPFYISPERARGGLADHRSDIYSLGATLFHALAGRPPFDGKTATDVVVARLKEPAPDIRQIVPSLQPETASVIGRMLEADTLRRYPTSASLQADLRAALDAARDAEKHGGHRMVARRKSNAPRFALFGALALVLVAATVWLFLEANKRNPPKPPPTPAGAGTAAAAGEPLGETFFAGKAEEALVLAARDLSAGQMIKMYTTLETLLKTVPPNSARAAWIRLFKSVGLWAEANETEARALLRPVATVKISLPDEHPVQMPKVLSLHMLNEMDDETFQKRAARWPSWYRDLASFFRGLEEYSAGDILKGSLHLQAYASSPREKPAWAYAFKPIAKKWLELGTKWETTRRQSRDLIAEGKMSEAKVLLEKIAPELPPFLRKHATADLARIQAATGGKSSAGKPSAK
jgi:hypothetical protein